MANTVGGPSQPDSSGRAASNWLAAEGTMGRAIAAYAWEKTPLGPLADWPLRLRMVVNLMLGAGAPMAIIWGPEFRMLYNERYAQIIQDKHPAALGAPAQETFPELWPSLQLLFARAFGGDAVLIEDYELKINRRGVTQQAYFSFSYNPIRDDGGQVDGFLAIVVETTARVVREQERAQVFNTVLSAIVDFVYTFDREGRFLYVNKALLDLWGLNLEAAVGKNFFDLKYPDDLATRLQNQIQQVIASKVTVRDETRYVSPAGVEGFYEYIFSPVFAPDGSVAVVAGSTRDITVRKKLELAALAAAKAKDDFLATLSHELRTPLNPVLLLATDAAANPALPAPVRADFKIIADNVTLEARLIDDLLDISRITHDKLLLNLRSHELQPLLLQAMESVRPELVEKRLDVALRLDASTARVAGDEVRLNQIFWNLFRNAAKFTPAGGQVTVVTRVEPGEAPSLVVEISDTGIGLTAAELDRVFLPFAQGEHGGDGSQQFGGLGLGLTIAYRLAELHAGSLSARSPGRNLGATFIVRLPLQPAGDFKPPSAAPVVPAALSRNASAPPRILLVEDHSSSRRALAQLLAGRKIEVVQAASAAEALNKAAAQKFDLVISDIGLPGTNGYELMAALKKKYGCVGIALSGYGTEEDIARSKAAGFIRHLTKPVQAQALDEALALFVKR